MINVMAVAFTFRDEAFEFETVRAMAGGSASRGEDSLDVGDVVGAREAFLRASKHYRAAELLLWDCPSKVLEALSLSRCSRSYFVRAAQMLDGPFRQVDIPYGGGELAGYLFLVDGSGQPRPTLIYTGGFTSTREEGYFAIGAAALRRGYNFLAYDGPGQGSMIREEKVPMRPDWENVLGPVVDYALTVPEIDDDKIVHFGHGLGGYFVARHAVHDHRSAAIVCNDGMTTFYASYPPIPEPILELIEDGHDDEAIPMLEVLMNEDADARWGLRNGQWVYGTDTTVDYVRRTAEYTLTATDVRKITTPALVLEGEDETVFVGQAANFSRAMTAPVHHVVTRHADAAMHQKVFDYLALQLR
jgi:pimeloyl-ACP methyl ester carboxylesterase